MDNKFATLHLDIYAHPHSVDFFFLIDSSAQGNTPAGSSQAQVQLLHQKSGVNYVFRSQEDKC